MTDPLLTPTEVADLCGVSTKTVLRAIRSGSLGASRLGSRGAYRIRPDDVDRWLDTMRVVPAPKAESSNSSPLRPLVRTRADNTHGRLAIKP